MSIGGTLAHARRQAGLTLAQVSQQTRIRESIISSIEQGDFSSCGGDFYARGHIRSIASAVHADPVALIRTYDEEHGPPDAMRAAQIFESTTPIRIRGPRRLRPGWVAAVAIVAVAGFVTYHVLEPHGANPAATATSRVRHRATAGPHPTATPKATATARSTTAHPGTRPQAAIRLTASQDCWVRLSKPSGQSIYAGTILAGARMTWHEKHAVSMVIGNPSGIELTVNGKAEKMNTVQVVTLTINPLSKTMVSAG